MDAAIPADAQNAPTGIWKSRTEREIPTAPTPIIVVVNERKNNGDSNSVAKPSTESDQAHLRLHPCSVDPAEDHEKCGPNRPTAESSCNNASHRRSERGPGCRPANSQRGTSSYTWDEPSTSSLQCGSCGDDEGRAKPPHPQIFRQQCPAWRRGPDTPVPSALAAGSRAVGQLWP